MRFPVVSMLDCGEKIIYSRHRHDYQEFVNSKGTYFMLDGGLDYQRFNAPKGIKPQMLYNDDPIILLREHAVWGKNFNEKNKLLPKTEWVFIKDITNDHLDSLIKYLAEINGNYLGIFIREKEYRTKISTTKLEILQKKYNDLQEEFEQYKKESIKWSVEDFTEYKGYKITPKKAQEALEDMIRHHDCTLGITWETIECYLDEYGKCTRRKK